MTFRSQVIDDINCEFKVKYLCSLVNILLLPLLAPSGCSCACRNDPCCNLEQYIFFLYTIKMLKSCAVA